MKVLVSDQIAEGTLSTLKNKEGMHLTYLPDDKGDKLTEALKTAEILVVRSGTKVTKELMEKSPNLKHVIRGGVGLDNIDLPAAREKNINVLNTPKATSVSVSELVLGLMLSLARRIPAADRSMKDGKWEKKKFKGRELYRKTLGILGIGRIGAEVARRASAFGMTVLAYDPYLDETQIRERGAEPAALDTAITSSDFITLHLPLTDETRNLIDKNVIAKMKDNVYILNCARGGVVHEADLLDALQSGKVAGAGFDVYENEPNQNQELVNHPNVIATPHVGASTSEGQARVGDEVIELIDSILKK